MKFKQDNNAISFENEKGNYIIQRANSLADALTNAHIEAINLKTSYESALKNIDGPKDLSETGFGLFGPGISRGAPAET